ncbi:MAG TPA: DUF6491 family protein [Steroidobacteraceae bacterium]|nr:DUF6491 family protein [Steroidobacteraceae bacterium]
MSAHIKHPARSLGILLLTVLLAGGCVSGPRHSLAPGPNPHDLAALPGKPGCFWLRNFDGSWTALNERQLLVYAPFTTAYLVQLIEPVPTLKFAERLGFEDVERTGMICNDNSDFALIPNWTPHQIAITAVHQVTPEQARQLLLSNGLKAPRHKAPEKTRT